MKKPTKEQILQEIFSKEYNPLRLPYDLYMYTALHLTKGLYKGYGKIPRHIHFNSPDHKLIMELRSNLYLFSGAKTFQQIKAMSELLTYKDEVVDFKMFKDGFIGEEGETILGASDIFDTFNTQWLKAEYSTAIGGGYDACNWQRFITNKEARPYILYNDVQDENECDICDSFHGLCARIDDPIWNIVSAVNHYQDRCQLDSLTEDEAALIPAYDKDKVNSGIEKMDDVFKHNPGKTGMVFNDKHPYFQIPRDKMEFARNNFGFNIPEDDK